MEGGAPSKGNDRAQGWFRQRRARRHVAGRERGTEKHHSEADERRRIARTHPKQKAARQPRRRKCAANPDGDAHEPQSRSNSNHLPPHLAGRRVPAILLGEFTPFQQRDSHIADSGSSHRSKKTRAWVAKQKTLHLTFTPTHASWLTQIEIWFGILTRKVVRRGIFKSREELVERLMNFIQAYNQEARPFEWAYTGNPLAA